MGAFCTSPAVSLQVEANEPSLESRRNKLAVQFLTKLKSNPLNPTYDCVFDTQYERKFENKPTAIPSFGFRIKKHILDMNLDLSTVIQNPTTTPPPWTLQLPKFNFKLYTRNKALTNPEVFKLHYHEILDEYHGYNCIYTDGSKDRGLVASAAVCGPIIRQCRLPNNSSIFTAELKAILLALDIIADSTEINHLILSDSLSSLQALYNTKLDNPLVQNILQRCHPLIKSKKTINFVWLPSHILKETSRQMQRQVLL